MLAREKYEKDNCGSYELIYPLVSYQEEFDINAGLIPTPVSSNANQQSQSQLNKTKTMKEDNGSDEEDNPVQNKSNDS